VMPLVAAGKMNKQVAGDFRNKRDYDENSSRCGNG